MPDTSVMSRPGYHSVDSRKLQAMADAIVGLFDVADANPSEQISTVITMIATILHGLAVSAKETTDQEMTERMLLNIRTVAATLGQLGTTVAEAETADAIIEAIDQHCAGTVGTVQ